MQFVNQICKTDSVAVALLMQFYKYKNVDGNLNQTIQRITQKGTTTKWLCDYAKKKKTIWNHKKQTCIQLYDPQLS